MEDLSQSLTVECTVGSKYHHNKCVVSAVSFNINTWFGFLKYRVDQKNRIYMAITPLKSIRKGKSWHVSDWHLHTDKHKT